MAFFSILDALQMMPSAICFNLDQSEILSSGNGLKNFYFILQGFQMLFSSGWSFDVKIVW